MYKLEIKGEQEAETFDTHRSPQLFSASPGVTRTDLFLFEKYYRSYEENLSFMK